MLPTSRTLTQPQLLDNNLNDPFPLQRGGHDVWDVVVFLDDVDVCGLLADHPHLVQSDGGACPIVCRYMLLLA